MGTGKQIADYARNAYAENGGYIWGESGAIWTEAKQKAATREMTVKYGAKWIGHHVWDCSGLTMRGAQAAGVSIHHGSNSVWRSDLKEKGPKTAGLQLPEGAFVFTGTENDHPHIGVVTGPDEVTEAKGTKAGVVHSKLSDKKWTYWGLCKNVTFDGEPEPGPEQKPTLRRGDSGSYVTLAQAELIQRGYDLGSYGADGKFGAKTEAAVKAFQRDWGLTVDGIIGQKTWAMLDSTPAKVQYYVVIHHLSLADAEALVALHPGAQMIKEDDA